MHKFNRKPDVTIHSQYFRCCHELGGAHMSLFMLQLLCQKRYIA